MVISDSLIMALTNLIVLGANRVVRSGYLLNLLASEVEVGVGAGV
jgi:hypothetical protein